MTTARGAGGARGGEGTDVFVYFEGAGHGVERMGNPALCVDEAVM